MAVGVVVVRHQRGGRSGWTVGNCGAEKRVGVEFDPGNRARDMRDSGAAGGGQPGVASGRGT